MRFLSILHMPYINLSSLGQFLSKEEKSRNRSTLTHQGNALQYHYRRNIISDRPAMRRFKSQKYFLCEVAPSMMMTHRRSTTCPRLETIFEEGAFESLSRAKTTKFQNRSIYLLPVFLSFISYYFLLYRL